MSHTQRHHQPDVLLKSVVMVSRNISCCITCHTPWLRSKRVPYACAATIRINRALDLHMRVCVGVAQLWAPNTHY